MKIIKYFFVGVVAALTDISLFYIFAKLLGYNYLIVAFFSFIIATFVNYILSIKYVFKSGIKFSKKKEISLIYVISGIALIINQVSLYILIDLITVEITLSKVIATIITFFWNYFIRRNYIFKEDSMKEPILESFLRKMRINKVLPIIKKYPNSKLLDIGCGFNYKFLLEVEPYISEGYGIDFKVSELKNEKIKTRQIKLDNKLPFHKNSFDFVTMLAVLEHLDHPVEIVREIERILKPEGKLILTVPSKYSKPVLKFLAYKLKIVNEEEINDHKKYYNYKDLEKLFKETDKLKIQKHRYFQFYMNNFCVAQKEIT